MSELQVTELEVSERLPIPKDLELLPQEKVVKVKIVGRAPGLLMNNPASMLIKKAPGPSQIPSPKEEAESRAYRMADGTLFLKGQSIYRSLVSASTSYRMGRKPVASILAGTVRVFPMEIPLGTKTYDIDIQTVVIKGSGRVVRARPWLKQWGASFYIVYDPEFGITSELLKRILEDAGRRMGVGDFRPQHKGQYGTFLIETWDDL